VSRIPYVGAGVIRRLALLVLLVAVVVYGGPSVVGRLGSPEADADSNNAGAGDGSTPSGSGSSSGARATAPITKRDLVDRVAVDGTLGYGATSAIAAGKPGTVMSVAAVGSTVSRGESLLAVDGRPLPLFFGTVPLWRALSVFSEDGPDIRQLEDNLVALGFAEGLDLVVDEHFDAATQIAVQRWQTSIDASPTAIVDKGDLVFRPGPVRVKEAKVAVGDEVQPGGPALVTTGVDRIVTVRLDAQRQSIARTGDAVQIDVPGASTLAGRVTDVGTVATKDDSSNGAPGGDGGTAKITVTIALDDPAAAGRLDEAPVRVKFTKDTAEQVLAVPVSALLALREGGYALEVDNGGRRTLVGVEVGANADGWVEVRGAVHEGDLVVVAS